jgi:16S rRNA U516 pseudouridylate synthase RsuA-like enzyme
VGAEAMDQNMVKLSKTISEATSGSKQAADAFVKMGIEVKNADGSVKNSEKVLMEMADKFIYSKKHWKIHLNGRKTMTILRKTLFSAEKKCIFIGRGKGNVFCLLI